MYHEHTVRFFLERVDPGEKSFPVGMTGKSVQTNDLRLDIDRLAEELHDLSAVDQAPPQGADSLVAGKHDRTLRSPEVVF